MHNAVFFLTSAVMCFHVMIKLQESNIKKRTDKMSERLL